MTPFHVLNHILFKYMYIYIYILYRELSESLHPYSLGYLNKLTNALFEKLSCMEGHSKLHITFHY